jgi:hypothetical protein
MDGVWGMTGQYDLEAALNEKYHIPSLTSGIICTKTQDQVVAILDDLTQSAGSDDLMQILTIKVGDIAKSISSNRRNEQKRWLYHLDNGKETIPGDSTRSSNCYG